MKIRIDRSGGFANMQATGSCDTDDLDPDAADEVRALVDALRAATDSPSHPDAFRYDVTIEDDDGNVISATIGESDAAARLLERLTAIQGLDRY